MCIRDRYNILQKKNTYQGMSYTAAVITRYLKCIRLYLVALTAISLYSLACNGQEERIEDTEKKGAFGVDGLHKHIIEWAGGGVSLSSSALFAGHG